MSDYSVESIKKGVMSEILSHAPTLCLLGLGFFGLIGMALFGIFWVTAVTAGLGLSLGTGTLLVNLFVRKDSFEVEYLKAMQLKSMDRGRQRLDQLGRSLEECLEMSDDDPMVKQGVAQFVKVQKKFGVLRDILSSKLSTGELAYGRFLTTSENVYHYVLDNLDRVITTTKAIGSYDIDYIEERFDILEELGDDRIKADNDELDTLNKRIDMRQELIDNLNALLTENEKAMTQIDDTTHKMNSTKMNKGRTDLDFETAMGDMGDLSERINRYAVK